MKKRFYIGLIIFAVLLLALGRMVVRPPVGGAGNEEDAWGPEVQPRTSGAFFHARS
jgi:hypothetical protein